MRPPAPAPPPSVSRAAGLAAQTRCWPTITRRTRARNAACTSAHHLSDQWPPAHNASGTTSRSMTSIAMKWHGVPIVRMGLGYVVRQHGRCSGAPYGCGSYVTSGRVDQRRTAGRSPGLVSVSKSGCRGAAPDRAALARPPGGHDYPTKPLRNGVAVPAGARSDILARLIGAKVQAHGASRWSSRRARRRGATSGSDLGGQCRPTATAAPYRVARR